MPVRVVMSSLLVAVLALSALAAGPSAEHFTVVGDEPCVAGPDVEEGATPDWVDLCTLAFATDTGRAAPIVAVQLTTVGSAEERPAPARWSVSWSAGSCDVTIVHADAVTGGDYDELVARCGEPDVRCEDELPVGDVPLNCTDRGSTFVGAVLAPPTVAGDTVTWVVELSGDLAPLAASHAAGSSIDEAEATAASSFSGRSPYDMVTIRSSAVTGAVCIVGTCSTPVDDLLVADRAHVIG